MWNVNCENVRHVQNNVTIASNRWFFQQLNCKYLLIVSNLNIVWFNLKTPEFFFSLTLSEFFMKWFLVEIFVSLFCSIGLLYLFIRVTS